MSLIEYQSLMYWDEWQEIHPVLPHTEAWAAAVIAFQVIGNLLLLSRGFAQFGNITGMTKCSCPCPVNAIPNQILWNFTSTFASPLCIPSIIPSVQLHVYWPVILIDFPWPSLFCVLDGLLWSTHISFRWQGASMVFGSYLQINLVFHKQPSLYF